MLFKIDYNICKVHEDICKMWIIKSPRLQIMACRLFGAKPLPEPLLAYCQVDPVEHILLKFHLKSNVFMLENWFENVICKMMAILSWPQMC